MKVDVSTIQYKIIGFEREMGQIVVEFEGAPPICVPLPIVDGKYPEGIELEQHIRRYVPVGFYERLNEVSNVSNVDAIISLVETKSDQSS